MRLISRKIKSTEFYVLLIILALAVAIQIQSGQFFTANNIVDLFSAFVVPGIFAIGEFLVILSGGIDVAFPALASLASYAVTITFLANKYQGSVLIPMIMAIAIGAVLGALNGALVGYFKLPAMIVTLGTASIFKGLMQGTLNSKQQTLIPKGMREFGTAGLITVTNQRSGLSSRLPIAIIILLVVFLISFFILRFTIFGRGIYAIGGAEGAAYNAGFAVEKTKFLLYVFAGVLAALGGMIRVSMMQQDHPTNMLGMEMNIIAGVVLGGASMTGGVGTLTGCFLGTFLIVMVENSMILLGIPTVWKEVFVGALIVIGTALSARRSVSAFKKNSVKSKKGVAEV